MYEVFFYAGIVFAIGALIIAFVLFFVLKIPEVIEYYIDAIRHRRSKKNVQMRKSSKKIIKTKRKVASVYVSPGAEETEMLNADLSAVESIARNYATAMLNADQSTEILD